MRIIALTQTGDPEAAPGARTPCAELSLGRFPALYSCIVCVVYARCNTNSSSAEAEEEGWPSCSLKSSPSSSPLLWALVAAVVTGFRWTSPSSHRPVQLLQGHWTGMFSQILQLSSRKAALSSSLNSFVFSGDYNSNSKVTIFNFSVIWKVTKKMILPLIFMMFLCVKTPWKLISISLCLYLHTYTQL